MSAVSKSYTFTPGTDIQSAQANQNFDDIVGYVNSEVIVRDGSKAFTATPSGPGTDPTTANQFARKQYVDTADNLRVKIDGTTAFTGIPSGPASDPTTDNQLTRKKYVDDNTKYRPSMAATGQIIKSDVAHTDATSSAGEMTVVFPTAFPNECRAVIITADNGAGPAFVSVTSKSKTQFVARLYTETVTASAFGGFSNTRYVGAANIYYTAIGS